MSELIGALRLDGDRRAIRLERSYPTDVKDLWAALTDPGRLSRWFARVEGDLRVGGTFCIYFDDEDADQRTIGQVRECDPPHRLTVTWYFRDEGESVVQAGLMAEPGGARLILDHRRMPPSSAAGYGAGWQTYLEQLAADLAGQEGHGAQWDQRWKELMPGYQAQAAGLER